MSVAYSIQQARILLLLLGNQCSQNLKKVIDIQGVSHPFLHDFHNLDHPNPITHYRQPATWMTSSSFPDSFSKADIHTYIVSHSVCEITHHEVN